jgi:hypothetical protein
MAKGKKKGKGLFGGFFRNIVDTDKDDDGVKDTSIIKNAMGLFSGKRSEPVDENTPTTKAFLGLESAKKNEKKTNTIIMVAVGALVLLFLFMRKK